MSLRFLGYFAFMAFALSLVPGTATAETTSGAGPAMNVVTMDAYGPNIQIVGLAELDTFSYKLHRERVQPGSGCTASSRRASPTCRASPALPSG